MGNFFAGVLCASVVWAIGVWAYTEGHLDRFAAFRGEQSADEGAEDDRVDEGDDESGRSRKRLRRGARRKQRGSSGGDPNRRMRVGEALGPREQIDMGSGAGEQQLTGAQIDGAFDKVMPAIRRCFFLVDGDMPTDGVLRFGLRIESSGKVSRSNLTGPSAMVQGEPGRCLRKAAEGAPFPSFDGPAMQIKYPVRLE